MTSILDNLLSATESSRSPSRVVSEQHDPNTINFVAGLSDPGEMIRCGYLPEIRRLPGEQDAEYAERIRPLVMALPKKERDQIMGAALKRASLDVTNGKVRVAVAGDVPWHALGTVFDRPMTAAQARAAAGMTETIKKLPLTYLDPVTGERRFATGRYGLVRDDTGAFLADVGSLYEPIQYEDGLDYLDGVIGKFNARYESAGVIHGGKKWWLQVHMPEQRFSLGDGDVTEPYVLFTNSHGDEAAQCLATTVRTVCANTFRTAMGKRGKGISLRHTGDIKAKINAAKEALGLAAKGFEQYAEAAQAMTTAKVDAGRFFEGVLDEVITYTEAEQSIIDNKPLEAVLLATEAERKALERGIERKAARREGLLEDMLTRYESRTNGVNGMRGTVWSAFNAVTETADHGKLGRQRGTREKQLTRRFESVIDGDADDLKQIAYTHAVGAMAV